MAVWSNGRSGRFRDLCSGSPRLSIRRPEIASRPQLTAPCQPASGPVGDALAPAALLPCRVVVAAMDFENGLGIGSC